MSTQNSKTNSKEDNKNNLVQVAQVREFERGPLAHTYSRAGYELSFTFSDGVEFAEAINAGWRIVDIKNGDTYNEETAEIERMINGGKDNIIRPAASGSNTRNLILMEIPTEKHKALMAMVAARNAEIIDLTRPDSSIGYLEHTHK